MTSRKYHQNYCISPVHPQENSIKCILSFHCAQKKISWKVLSLFTVVSRKYHEKYCPTSLHLQENIIKYIVSFHCDQKKMSTESIVFSSLCSQEISLKCSDYFHCALKKIPSKLLSFFTVPWIKCHQKYCLPLQWMTHPPTISLFTHPKKPFWSVLILAFFSRYGLNMELSSVKSIVTFLIHIFVIIFTCQKEQYLCS